MRGGATLFGLALIGVAWATHTSFAQQPVETPLPQVGLPAPPVSLASGQSPLSDPIPAIRPHEKSFPINLATALQLAGAKSLDVQIAGRQVDLAARSYDRAKLLWVPNLVGGIDYLTHTGSQQNFVSDIIKQNRSTFMAGVGGNVVFSLTDAIYAPLVARQDVRARQAAFQAVSNDNALQIAEVYFTLQQARGELAGISLATRKTEEAAKRTEQVTPGLAPPLEATRARVELARRKQAEIAARERWQTASAELTRLLRIDPTAILEPVEPPFLPITVIQESSTLDELIPIALTTRPELASQQAVVRATLARLKQEKMRPLIPSLALRGASTNPAGTLAYGTFGGGPNDRLRQFGHRFDVDLQVLWEFQNLGFGNSVRISERRTENEIATLDLFRIQDRIASEVATAYAQARSASERLVLAEPALKDAVELVERSLEGMAQTRRVGDVITLVVRPQEVIAAVQSLAQANTDFHTAVADYNRAQFRLYRSLGHPAQSLAGAVQIPEQNPAEPNKIPPVK